MIVVDASVVFEYLGQTGSLAALRLERSIRRRETSAPALIDAEVAQVVRRFERQGSVDRPRSQEVIDDLLDLPIRRYPHRGILQRAFDLRDNVTIYDGLYLALTEALACEFVTGDAGLANVPGCRATVTIVDTA